MNKEAVEAFKRELRNYSYYKLNLEGTIKLIDMNEYLLENVHGVDPGKEPSGSSGSVPWVESDSYHRIQNELEKLNSRLKLRISQVNYIESVLDQLDPEIREVCIQIYEYGKSYEEIAYKNHLSVGALYKRIERALRRIP